MSDEIRHGIMGSVVGELPTRAVPFYEVPMMNYEPIEREYPLDEFDYELARRADDNADAETVSFDELLQGLGIRHEELQEN